MGEVAKYRWLPILALTLLWQLISSRVPDVCPVPSLEVSKIDHASLAAAPQSCFVIAEGKQGDGSKFESPGKSSLPFSSPAPQAAAGAQRRPGRSDAADGLSPPFWLLYRRLLL